MNPTKDIDSKFRYVIIAAKRAKQLLKGSRPKIKSKSKNLIRVAQEEVKRGYIEYELVTSKKDEPHVIEEEALIGDDLVSAVETMAEKGINVENDVLSGLMSLGLSNEDTEDQEDEESASADKDDEPETAAPDESKVTKEED